MTTQLQLINIIIIIIIKEILCDGCGLNLCGSTQSVMAGSHECGNKQSVPTIRRGNFERFRAY